MRTVSPACRRFAAAATLAGLVAAGAAACTDDPVVPIGPHQLISFDSCDSALRDLRAATREAVGPYGLWGADPWLARGGAMPPAMAAETADRAAVPGPDTATDYSGTNVHEAGVDEPDIVKTDGRRIVTIADGRLRIVDVATRRLAGELDLRPVGGGPGITYEGNLLLAGDHAFIYANEYSYAYDDLATADQVGSPQPPRDQPVAGASLLLVDVAHPRVLSRARTDGYVVDARQVGSTVRIVVRSTPRLEFPYLEGTDEQRLAANRAVIDAADISAWAPRLEVTTAGQTVRTQVPCQAMSRPAVYSGTGLLTVMTFDATRDELQDGSPLSIVADGSTVYSTEGSLYVAANPSWRWSMPMPFAATAATENRTQIYRFDTSEFRPRYAGGGTVPGTLVNQYAMSEWDGHLRVATTTDPVMTGAMPTAGMPATQSGVYVLATEGASLTPVGAVEGLGKGERIYGVRFVGPVGYVVTFRQTDPLYTLDLHDPAHPAVRGELKIPGYSAYLHPFGDSRLIGVGQDATDQGRVLGTQIALFDVADLDAPVQLAKHVLAGAYSEAEVDPHAFLFWPRSGLLVLPLQNPALAVPDGPTFDRAFVELRSGALVLKVEGTSIVERGLLTQPIDPTQGYVPPIRRSLVTVDAAGDTTLWTVSAGGIMATAASTLARLAWIAL